MSSGQDSAIPSEPWTMDYAGSDLPLPAAGYRHFQRYLFQLRSSYQRRDGFVLQLLERAAALAARPGHGAHAMELLELASADGWLTCQTIRQLAMNADQLDGSELNAFVACCLEALDQLADPDASDLLEDLARADCWAFLRSEALLSIRRVAPGCAASRLASSLRRLPPSERGRLDLDLLVNACLERMGDEHPAVAFEPLLQTVSLRHINEEMLRERLVERYARALTPAQLGRPHRERLYYLARYAIKPSTRARILALHDLSRLNAVSLDVSAPAMLLDTLVHFPAVLEHLGDAEAHELIAYVLSRLYRYLEEEDHLLIGKTLCYPLRPEPFLSAYRTHLEQLNARASTQSQLELWSACFSAWLSPQAGELQAVMRPLLQQVVAELERPMRRTISQQLRARLGVGLRVLRDSPLRSGLPYWRWLLPGDSTTSS